MGPMAKIIFLDSMDEWVKHHQPSEACLPELIKILHTEIVDPKKIQTFHTLIPEKARPA
jgi:hypothetical protein